MKVKSMHSGDLVWVYCSTLHRYLELEIVEHNVADGTTRCAVTGRSELQVPEDCAVISSLQLEYQPFGNKDAQYLANPLQ